MCDNIGKCGFAGTGRTPEYHGRHFAFFNGSAQNSPFTHQVFLPDEFLQAGWPYPFCQRYPFIHGLKVTKNRLFWTGYSLAVINTEYGSLV
jgi:hypothetical protein